MTDHIHNTKRLLLNRKSLRNNSTEEEVILWNVLKGSKLGYKFRRQHSINNYIVDFFCPSEGLIIELDGGQHLDSEEYDGNRTEYLKSLGLRVIRFWNGDVKNNLNGVVMKIEEELRK